MGGINAEYMGTPSHQQLGLESVAVLKVF